ncbi:hypothetical protein Tco_0642048 [Tanacetum coccineum]
MQVARDRRMSYANVRRKPPEFHVGDKVMLKVSPWKGAICFGKQGKLNPRYIRPFKIVFEVGPLAYRLELPQELSGVHITFHVLNLKKCLSDESLVIPLEEIQVNDKLHFMEEPVEIMDREIKQLKRSRISIIKLLTAIADVDYGVALRRYKEQQVQHVADRVLLEGRWMKLFKILGVACYKGNLNYGEVCFIQGDDYISTSGEALAL